MQVWTMHGKLVPAYLSTYLAIELKISTFLHIARIKFRILRGSVVNGESVLDPGLQWNDGPWLVKNSHVTCNIESECFISVKHSNAILKFVYTANPKRPYVITVSINTFFVVISSNF